jgi:hypothetical protein
MALTVLGVFQMRIYATGEAYSFKDIQKMRFSEYTFGNLGYDSIQCNVAPIMQGRLYMSCPYGNIQWNPADLGWGFNEYEDNDRNRCIRQDLDCKEIDSAIFEKIVTENCTDQKSCIIPIPEVLKDLGKNQNQSSTIFI